MLIKHLSYPATMQPVLSRIQDLLLTRGLFVSKKQATASTKELISTIWPTKIDKPLIRIGSTTHADGGYLVPDDLSGIQRVFSPGVADTMDFEKHFLDLGIPCEMLDGSVEGAPEPHELASFQKLWLAAVTAQDSISLDDWVSQASKPKEDLVLQMDIEGAEYEALLAASSQTLNRFRIIVLELHDLRSVMSRMGLALFRSTLLHLRKTHEVVHAHPNNCCRGVVVGDLEWPDVLEITLLRKDRVSENLGRAELPHPLDRDNTPNRPIILRQGT